MLGFKRVFIALFFTFAAVFIFIMIIRLANNKSGFLGFNDLLSYFESIDLYKPLNNFKNTFDNLKKVFDDFARSININTIFNNAGGSGGRGTDSNFWDNLVSGISSIFGWLGNNVANLFKMLYTIMAMPIHLLFDLINLIIDYFGIFIKFIDFIINFEGYTFVSPLS